MNGRRKVQKGYEAPVEDRDWYIKENAVLLVRERDEKICKLRKKINDLEKSRIALRGERDRWRKDGAEYKFVHGFDLEYCGIWWCIVGLYYLGVKIGCDTNGR